MSRHQHHHFSSLFKVFQDTHFLTNFKRLLDHTTTFQKRRKIRKSLLPSELLTQLMLLLSRETKLRKARARTHLSSAGKTTAENLIGEPRSKTESTASKINKQKRHGFSQFSEKFSNFSFSNIKRFLSSVVLYEWFTVTFEVFVNHVTVLTCRRSELSMPKMLSNLRQISNDWIMPSERLRRLQELNKKM